MVMVMVMETYLNWEGLYQRLLLKAPSNYMNCNIKD